MTKLKKIVGLNQHHDAITGTQKERVSNNYIQFLKSNLTNVEKIFKEEIEKEYNIKIGNICYNNYIVDQTKCSGEYTILENNTKNEIIIGLYNPNLEGKNLITIEIKNSLSLYKIENIESDFYCINNLDNFNYENKCFLNFFINLNSNMSFIYIKLIKTNEKIKDLISINKQFTSNNKTNIGEIKLIQNYKLIKELSFDFNSLLFTLEYWNYNREKDNHNLEKVIFNYYDAIYYEYGEYPSNNSDDFVGCNADHYIFRPTSYKPIPIEIDLNKFYIIKGDISLTIIIDNKNMSYTILNLFYEPFFIKIDHIFNSLLENEKINNKSQDYVFVFNSSINNNDNNNITKFYTDSNGLEMMERKVNSFSYEDTSEEKTASNFYPVSSYISIQDNNNYNNKITIFTDKSQSGSSLFKGNILLLLNRIIKYYHGTYRLRTGEQMIEYESYHNINFKLTHLIVFGNNIFTGSTPIDTENYLNFLYNYFNKAFIMFKILNSNINGELFKKYNIIANNLINYVLLSNCIRVNYQLINEKVIIGEYFKYHQEYFYGNENNQKRTNYINRKGIISLRFPYESKILVKYDKKGIYYKVNEIFPNENELKEWVKPNNINLILNNNTFIYIYYFLN